MKTYAKVDVYLNIFITSALDRAKCLALRLGRFNSRGRGPNNN